MDRAFHSHTAAADLASKQEIVDLMLPSAALGSRSNTLTANGDEAMQGVGAEKALGHGTGKPEIAVVEDVNAKHGGAV
jgi:hypothetical protein